jgi:hypothetical protein
LAFPRTPLRLLLIRGFAMAGNTTMQAFCYDGYGGGAAALKVYTVLIAGFDLVLLLNYV